MTEDQGRLTPGECFGGPDGDRFLVEEVVGRGGQAVVYRVLDRRLDRLAALKVSTASGADQQINLERFESEQRHASRVRHPHVLQVHDCGELPDGAPWVLLEWMEHGSLGGLIRGARSSGRYLPMPHVLYYGIATAAALRAAHAVDLVHRDVKPDNVLIGADGVAKITDFGIAKDLTVDGEGLTRVGHTLGTLGFMAPEHLRGMPGKPSDIFAWGATLYAALVGNRPPQQTVNDYPVGVVEEGWSDPVPPCFRPVLAGALAGPLEERFSSFSEVLAVLQSIRLPDVEPRPIVDPDALPSLPLAAFMSGATEQHALPALLLESATAEAGVVTRPGRREEIVETEEAPTGERRPAPTPEPAPESEPEAPPPTREGAPAPPEARPTRPEAASVSSEGAPGRPEAARPHTWGLLWAGLAAAVAVAGLVVGVRPEPDPVEEVAAAVRYGELLGEGEPNPDAGPLPASAAERAGGRLVLAYDALVRGDWDLAARQARAVSVEHPGASAHARLVEAAALRLGSHAGYVAAASLYAEAATCSRCGDVAARAEAALRAACMVADAPRCPPLPLSARDREFVAAAVLWDDAHTEAANARLASALDLPGDTPSCIESQVLRGWAGDVPGLSTARVAAARVPADCEAR